MFLMIPARLGSPRQRLLSGCVFVCHIEIILTKISTVIS